MVDIVMAVGAALDPVTLLVLGNDGSGRLGLKLVETPVTVEVRSRRLVGRSETDTDDGVPGNEPTCLSRCCGYLEADSGAARCEIGRMGVGP